MLHRNTDGEPLERAFPEYANSTGPKLTRTLESTMTTKKATDYTADLQNTYAETMQKFAALAVENTEKSLELQMGIFKSYMDTAMGQYKAFAGVTDVKDMPEMFKDQAAQMQAVSAKSAADLAELVKVNTAYGQEVQGLVRDMAAKVMPKAA